MRKILSRIMSCKNFESMEKHVSYLFTISCLNLERFDHSPDYDHTDDMVGLTCCPRLKIFASASRDGTIRIWNRDNSLMR